MKIINHIAECPFETVVPSDDEFWDKEDAWFDNRAASIVRVGGEPFESHYLAEIFRESFVVDPRRSFVESLYARADELPLGCWEMADFLHTFLRDVGIDIFEVDRPSRLAFHMMVPRIAAESLSESYFHNKEYNLVRLRYRELPRVVNNPFFYRDSCASSKRLLEIAQDDGCAYAVDMSVEIPTAEVLAHEIALVNHIQDGEAAVAAAEREILRQIQEVL